VQSAKAPQGAPRAENLGHQRGGGCAPAAWCLCSGRGLPRPSSLACGGDSSQPHRAPRVQRGKAILSVDAELAVVQKRTFFTCVSNHAPTNDNSRQDELQEQPRWHVRVPEVSHSRGEHKVREASTRWLGLSLEHTTNVQHQIFKRREMYIHSLIAHLQNHVWFMRSSG